MNKKIPEFIKIIARDLRKNHTKAENLLWNELRYDKIGFRFLRQKPIYVYTENFGLDRFVIPDFYCNDKKIIIEVDGTIHNLNEIIELDLEKEKLLNKLGIKIFRVNNNDILNNMNLVIFRIKQELNKN